MPFFASLMANVQAGHAAACAFFASLMANVQAGHAIQPQNSMQHKGAAASHQPERSLTPAALGHSNVIIRDKFILNCSKWGLAVTPAACMGAGFGARAAPQALRQMAETRRVRQEDADFEKIVSQGLGPMDNINDDLEARPCTAPACCARPGTYWPCMPIKLHIWQPTQVIRPTSLYHCGHVCMAGRACLHRCLGSRQQQHSFPCCCCFSES